MLSSCGGDGGDNEDDDGDSTCDFDLSLGAVTTPCSKRVLFRKQQAPACTLDKAEPAAQALPSVGFSRAPHRRHVPFEISYQRYFCLIFSVHKLSVNYVRNSAHLLHDRFIP